MPKQQKPRRPNLDPYLKRLKANEARHGNSRSKRAIDDMGWTGAYGGFGILEDALKNLFDERLSLSQNMYSIVDKLSLDYTWSGDKQATDLLGKIHEFVQNGGQFPAGPGAEGFTRMAGMPGFGDDGQSPDLRQGGAQKTPGEIPEGEMPAKRLRFSPEERAAWANYAPNVPGGPAGDTDDNQGGGSQVYMQVQFKTKANKPKPVYNDMKNEYVEEIFEHTVPETPNMGWQIATQPKDDQGRIKFPYWDPRTYGLHNKEGWFFFPGAYGCRYVWTPKYLQDVYKNCKSLTIHKLGCEIMSSQGDQYTTATSGDETYQSVNNFTYDIFEDKSLHIPHKIDEAYLYAHLPNYQMTIPDWADAMPKDKFYLKPVGNEFRYCNSYMRALFENKGTSILRMWERREPYLVYRAVDLANYGKITTTQIGKANFKKVWSVNKTFTGPYHYRGAIGGRAYVDPQPSDQQEIQDFDQLFNLEVTQNKFKKSTMYRPSVNFNNPDTTYMPQAPVTITPNVQDFGDQNIGDRINSGVTGEPLIKPIGIKLSNMKRNRIPGNCKRFGVFHVKYWLTFSSIAKDPDTNPFPTVEGGMVLPQHLRNIMGEDTNIEATDEQLDSMRSKQIEVDYQQLPVADSDLKYPAIISQYYQSCALQKGVQPQSHKPEIYADHYQHHVLSKSNRTYNYYDIPFDAPVPIGHSNL